MDLKEMMVSVIYQNAEGMAPLQIVEALADQFGRRITTKQVLQTVQRNPNLFVDADGRIVRPSDGSLETRTQKMDLKDMVVSVVYQSEEGLGPLEIAEELAHKFGKETTTKQILQTVQRNPNLFVERDGRVSKPSDTTPETSNTVMDLKEMVVSVVYQTVEGMVPVEIAEALANKFGKQTTTRQILQTVKRNPNLFTERDGRVSRPSDSPPERGSSGMDLKEMMVTVVYQNAEGMTPLQIVETLAHQFDKQITTKQVLQTVQRNPKLFIERDGKVQRSPDRS